MGIGGAAGLRVDAPGGVTGRPRPWAGSMADHDVPDQVTLAIPRGGRVIVISDLHLTGQPSAASLYATEALARALDGATGAGVVVLAGDCFEMLAGPQLDPGPALDAHPELTRAVTAWGARPDRAVVVLPGNHDGPLAWHLPAITAVRRRMGATVALTLALEVDTGAGTRRVLVEHGHQLDPANGFVDPRDPAETPLGHHVVTDLLPLVRGITHEGWAQGLEQVADPLDLPALVSSRLTYRRLAPALAWVGLPGVVALVLGLIALLGAPAPVGALAWISLGCAVVVLVAVLGGAAFWGGLAWRSVRGATFDLSGGAEPGNDGPRRRASTLATTGFHAYVSGHTHIPELGPVDGALYANSGCGGGLLHRRPGRGPFPDAFALALHVSWVELDAQADLVARLVVGFEEVDGLGRLERWATRPAAPAPVAPTVVATREGPGAPVPVRAPVLVAS